MVSAARNESRPRGLGRCRNRGTLRRGIAPHGGVRPRERRLLLRRHADRVGPSLPRQQSLTVFPAARGAALHPAARPHPALVGLRARRGRRSFSGDPAGGLAAVVHVDRRGVRRCQVRRGSGGDSPSDHVSPQGDHASSRDSLRRHRSSARSLRDRLLGCRVHGLLRFWHSLLDRMAQPGRFECGNHRRPGAGTSAGRAPSVRRTSESRVPGTRAGSGSRRCVYRWVWESSSSIKRPRVPTLRPLSCMRRFPCSSGRRFASGSVESASRC